MGTNNDPGVSFQKPNEELMERIHQKSPHRAEQIEDVDEALRVVIGEQGLNVEPGGADLVEAWTDLRDDILMTIL